MLVILPVTALAGVLLVHSVNVEYAEAEARLRQLSTALSEDIERDVERHVLVLNTLSTAPSFGADWPAFDDRARRALQGDGYIVVIDRSLRQKINTYVPYGQQPARTGDVETAERILASKKVEVSSVFTSLVTRGPVINIDIPLIRNGEVQYILMYGRPVEHLTTILREQALDPGWTSSVFDRHGRLITNSAGTRSTRPEQGPLGANGVSRLTDAAGQTILRATHTSPVTGWTVVVDVPLSVVMHEANRTLQWWVLFAITTILVAAGFGVAFGRFLSRQLRGAAAFAKTIVQDESAPQPGPTTLQEIDLISEALLGARTELNARMERQRLLSGELNHRVKNQLSVVQALVKRTLANSRPIEQSRELLMQRLQALSRSQDLLTRSHWTDLPFRQIVDMEVAPFADRVECKGPDILVGAQNVQNCGLLIHELTTNAVKHGALRDGGGTVDVCWSAQGDRFAFQWKEHCTPVDSALAPAGFGTTLLKSIFRSPDTIYRLEVEPDGFRFELDAPLHLVTGTQAPQPSASSRTISASMSDANSEASPARVSEIL